MNEAWMDECAARLQPLVDQYINSYNPIILLKGEKKRKLPVLYFSWQRNKFLKYCSIPTGLLRAKSTTLGVKRGIHCVIFSLISGPISDMYDYNVHCNFKSD